MTVPPVRFYCTSTMLQSTDEKWFFRRLPSDSWISVVYPEIIPSEVKLETLAPNRVILNLIVPWILGGKIKTHAL
ncbi:hypothetical protein AY547_02210 [Corynebacterium diphtheriae bv. gravis]|nr:hypothetical protein AL07_07660 [Corynebacterium diphtheriae bv. gravis str. ISS 4060]OWN02617.1 hypothetical protein AY476_01025 [Corynebacterium diphtheriae bv. mitis]OWN09827.1 hypothetical protein AY479_01840 [Corynebacterium belfantii]OWN25146.1 hypothetical protein AY503_04575 [Corynebacterium diphtheriae bv. gravis]OWN13646.1 hypothetical protein AY505_01105 [Corynebacterium belfantii]